MAMSVALDTALPTGDLNGDGISDLAVGCVTMEWDKWRNSDLLWRNCPFTTPDVLISGEGMGYTQIGISTLEKI